MVWAGPMVLGAPCARPGSAGLEGRPSLDEVLLSVGLVFSCNLDRRSPAPVAIVELAERQTASPRCTTVVDWRGVHDPSGAASVTYGPRRDNLRLRPFFCWRPPRRVNWLNERTLVPCRKQLVTARSSWTVRDQLEFYRVSLSLATAKSALLRDHANNTMRIPVHDYPLIIHNRVVVGLIIRNWIIGHRARHLLADYNGSVVNNGGLRRK